MPHAIESSCWASRLPPHVLFAARLPGRPSDFREEKSTHMTRGKKNSVGDLNACMSVLALQWKDTHVVNIIELFLYFNRLGYKQFVRKRESFCEKCFCACVCDWPPSVGEDYYLIIRQACSIWSPLKRKNNRGRAGHKRESWREREWQSKGETENTNQGRTWEKISLFNHSSNFQSLSTAEEKQWKGKGEKISFSLHRYRSITLFQKPSELPKKIYFLINIFVLFWNINI